MQEEQARHPGEEEMEEYALGMLPQRAIPGFEQHLLICHRCQDRMVSINADVQAMQAEARRIRAREAKKRRAGRSSAGRGAS